MCEEESDDAEAVAKLLEINDSIHRTIERYRLVKQGDLEGASKIPKGTLGTSTGVKKTADNELSLIDFSTDAEPSAGTNGQADGAGVQPPASIEDDLLGLSMQDENYGQSGGIALGFGANTSMSICLMRINKSNDSLLDIPGPSLLSSTTQQSSAKPGTPQPPSTQQTTPAPPKPNYDPFSTFSSSQSASGTATPSGPAAFQTPQPFKSPPPSADPFAALASTAPRQPSPLPQQTQPQPSTSSSFFDYSSPAPQPTLTSSISNQKDKVPDDDWDFASALPEDTHLPTSNEVIVTNTSVKILFRVSRSPQSSDTITITAHVSNNTSNLISEYTFQVAVTKVMFLAPPFRSCLSRKRC